MTPLFKKLNFKQQSDILCLNAPESFDVELDAMAFEVEIIRDINETNEISFALVFATAQQQIEETVKHIYPKLVGDAVLWYCYPKGTSQKYACDFNRDTGWVIMGEFNLEGVRMVAIDEDWSALRFRKVEYIKKLTRRQGMALSKEGKKRTSGKG